MGLREEVTAEKIKGYVKHSEGQRKSKGIDKEERKERGMPKKKEKKDGRNGDAA